MGDMDERLLRAFVTVAREGSFSRAAVSLGYSQPAVTHQVHLGFRLFDRGVVPPRLTPEGRERLVASEAILSLMDALRRPVATLIARASTQSAAG
jgi:DNA-binding transcriptional LysR family regulator